MTPTVVVGGVVLAVPTAVCRPVAEVVDLAGEAERLGLDAGVGVKRSCSARKD